MCKHRNPQASVSKQAPSDNFNPGPAIELLYNELVEVEAQRKCPKEPYRAAGGSS